MSALYAISPGRKFSKKIKMSIQHCGHLVDEKQLERLCFIKACGTANPNDPYVFKFVKRGVFTITSQYCELWQSDFSIYGVGEKDDDSNDDGGNPEGDGIERNQSNESDNTGSEEHPETEESHDDTGSEEHTSSHDDTGSGGHTGSHDDTGSEDDVIPNISNTTTADSHQDNNQIIRQQQQHQQQQTEAGGNNQTNSPSNSINITIYY